jgi:flagellar basal body-associated protein FliL
LVHIKKQNAQKNEKKKKKKKKIGWTLVVRNTKPKNMSLVVSLVLLCLIVVVTVRSECTSHNDCLTCLQEKPDTLLTGLFCVMCLNEATNRTLCMGNFGETLKIAKCVTKADEISECVARFPATTTTMRTTTTTPSPTPFATLAPTPPTTVAFFTPSGDDNQQTSSGGGDSVAIAIGVVVALIVLALFVLAGVYIVLKYRKQAQQTYPTFESQQPSFAVGSGRVMDHMSPGSASGYSGRDTYSASDSRPYAAMPYSPSEHSSTTVDMRSSSNKSPIREQYYDLNVIRPPPKTIDLDGNVRASEARSGTIADNLPDIPSGYSGQSKIASQFDDSMAIRDTGVDGDDVPLPDSLRAIDAPAEAEDEAASVSVSARKSKSAAAAPVESESTRIANEFDAMQAMLDDV